MNGIMIFEDDGSILIDKTKTDNLEVVKFVQRFADHSKTLGHYECYTISSLSIWNALSSGIHEHKIMQTLERYAIYPISLRTQYELRLWFTRFNKLTLHLVDEQYCNLVGDERTIHALLIDSFVQELAIKHDTHSILFSLLHRGLLKQHLVKLHYNVIDECGFHNGEGLVFNLLKKHKFTGKAFELREYQRKAIASFHRDRIGGSGVIVLPCGTGKTLTGIGVMASLQCETLIITTNTISCEQWKDEILSKTSIEEHQVGIYGGNKREVKAITIATYNILSFRDSTTLSSPHMKLFNERDWGLIIYDEVHLLPAPIFRMTASIQATRRLGLTATLIREDGCAPDVYSLVGAKLYDLHWKEAEQQKVIAQVSCLQVHIPLDEEQVEVYSKLTKREQYKFASINEHKYMALRTILDLHKTNQIIVIGQYLEQLEAVATLYNIPLVTGQTTHDQRQQLFQLFVEQKIRVLALSKIANLALNLPNASIAVQISGSYGSRQEEAQRVGRIIRPKQEVNEAIFYSLVSKGTMEEQFSLNRIRFLQEQGYTYSILSLEQLKQMGGESNDDVINS